MTRPVPAFRSAAGTARTRLLTVPVDLVDAMAGRMPTLPMLARAHDGYLLTSLAEPRIPDLAAAAPEYSPHVHRYHVRYHTDLTGDFGDYWRWLAEPVRDRVCDAARRVAAISGGAVRVTRYRAAGELVHFHDVARRISARTYRERLLGAGLPDDERFLAGTAAAAAADRARGWLLTVAGEPAAYLYAEGSGRVLRRSHAGHDPAFDDFDPAAVLLCEALRELMPSDRFERFDFDTGDAAHVRGFATGGVPCADVMLLRPSLATRVSAGALGAFDQAVGRARQVARHPRVQHLARKVRRD